MKTISADKIADDLIYAGRIIERMLDPRLKPLSRDNARQFDNAVCTEHDARVLLRRLIDGNKEAT